MLKRIVSIFITLVLFILPLSVITVSAEGTETNYVMNLRGKRQAIPLCYSVVKTYSFFNLGTDTLKEPTDLFIDGKDRLYILDSGNGRIIKLSPEGEILKEYIPEGESALNTPNGIYVDEDENIFVADTENSRIIVFDKDGNTVKIFVQPTSDLYDKEYPFKPIKVGIDNLGQLYLINSNDYHGFTILDSKNRFKGYMGATRVGKGVWDDFIYFFATPEQKIQLGKRIPPMHTNFTIPPDGSIYTTTANVSNSQLKRFSSTGNNFYPNTGSFGDTTTDYLMTKFGKDLATTKASIVDVCVDENYIATILDNVSGRVYQYDQDGIMIASFGGTGNWKGKFQNAVAMDNDSKGQLYILDKLLCTVQIFKPTKFIETVHTALGLYNSGAYFEAQKIWQEILTIDAAYPVAHIGMGKAELKKQNFEAAMIEYKTAGDKYGYSTAFNGYFKKIIQNYFAFIVFGVCALIVVLYIVISKLYRKAKIYSGGRVV